MRNKLNGPSALAGWPVLLAARRFQDDAAALNLLLGLYTGNLLGFAAAIFVKLDGATWAA